MLTNALSLLLPFIALVPSTVASPLVRRQNATQYAEIGTYLQQVESALYAVTIIQAGNASAVCSESDLIDTLDTEGYNGTLAQTLICESAAGFQIFPDVNQAANDLVVTLGGLEAAQIRANLSCLLTAEAGCPNPDEPTLSEAGLDAEGIWGAICDSFDLPVCPASGTTVSISTISNASTTAQATGGTASTAAGSASSEAAYSESVTSIDRPATTLSPPSSVATFTSATPSATANATAFASLSSGSLLSTAPASSPVTSNSTTAASSEVVITATITSYDTVWVVGTPLSFPLPSSDLTNSTTTVFTTSTTTRFTTVTETNLTSTTTLAYGVYGSGYHGGPWGSRNETWPHGHGSAGMTRSAWSGAGWPHLTGGESAPWTTSTDVSPSPLQSSDDCSESAVR